MDVWADGEGRGTEKEDEQLPSSYSKSLCLFVHLAPSDNMCSDISGIMPLFKFSPLSSFTCDWFVLSRERSGKLLIRKGTVKYEKRAGLFSHISLCSTLPAAQFTNMDLFISTPLFYTMSRYD